MSPKANAFLDHKKFASSLGQSSGEVFPLMSRDWQVRVSKDKREMIRHQLGTFRVGADQLFSVSEDTDGYLFVETAVTRLVDQGEVIYQGDQSFGLFGEFFTRTAVKSGHHTGMGVMWSSQNLEALGVKNSIPLTKVFDISSQVLAQ